MVASAEPGEAEILCGLQAVLLLEMHRGAVTTQAKLLELMMLGRHWHHATGLYLTLTEGGDKRQDIFSLAFPIRDRRYF